MKRLVQVLMLLVLIAVLAISPVTNANDAFPRKTVEFIVPWAAGGGVDTLMRAIAAVFPKYANNEQMIIKNVPGGGGAIGFNEAAKARPDGYTLTSGTTPLITK
ncbi:MAG TPA: tripartite tricarboxylate transporter substrate binding protein, partial [Firmicutes bacterium]|nr:tripartite tricarboxylate transporter substrate binding protein [Bacillota bacterium]